MKGLAIFLGGVIVGAAATALVTPQRGDELRARIKDYLKQRGLVEPDEIDNFVEIIAEEIEDR